MTRNILILTGWVLLSATARTEAAPILPNAVSGLQLWFDASDLNGDGVANNPANNTLVSQWDDRSGANRDATQPNSAERPAFISSGAFPVVRFTAATLNTQKDFLSIAATPAVWSNTNGLTIISVAKGGADQAILSQYHGGNNQRFFRDETGRAALYPNPTIPPPTGQNEAAHANPADFVVRSTVWTPSSSLNRFLNGALAASLVSGVTSGLNLTNPQTITQTIEIGSQGAGDFNNLAGDIAEIIVFNRALTAAERQGIEAYLGQKYGLSIVPEPDAFVLAALGIFGCLPVWLQRRYDAAQR